MNLRKRAITSNPLVRGGAAALLALAVAGGATAGAADRSDPALAPRVLTLTRATQWRPVAAIGMRFRTFHPQGMVKVGRDFFVSSVEVTTLPKKLATPDGRHDRDAGAGVGHLFKVGPDGTLLADLRIGEGTIYHPGGIDFDGTSIWVPVAEYRPNSRSIVYKVDPRTMQATEVLRADDHVGAVVHDLADGTLRGVTWGSRTLLTWPLDAEGHVDTRRTPARSVNSAQYIDYQDCHYIGADRMLCAGLGEYASGGSPAVFQLGGLELVDLRENRPVWQVPVELRAPSGRVMTQNPFFVEPTKAGLRTWFLPDDDASTLFAFDAVTG